MKFSLLILFATLLAGKCWGQSIQYATPAIDLSPRVTFDGNPLDVTPQESGPSGIAFNPSGTKLFIVGSIGDEVNQYSLANPFDITSGVTFDGSPFNVNNEDASPTGITFNPRGTKMFIIGVDGNEVNQYSLANPFDITSGVTFDGTPFLVGAEEGTPLGITFSPNGTKMFVVGLSGAEVNQYSLSNPFDITSGVTFDGTPFSVASEEPTPTGIAFNADGTRMFIVGSSGDNINPYNLSNPFDITSGVTFDGNPFSVTDQHTSPQGIAFNASGTKMFIVGSSGREVSQFSLNNEQVFIETIANNGAVTGSIIIRLIGEDTFVNVGSTLFSDTHFTLNNLPAGLTPTMTVAADGTSATLTLGGNATSNQSTDNVSDLQFTFTDAAFTSGNATGLANAVNASSGLGIVFDIAPEFLSSNSAAIPENETAVALNVDAIDGFGGAVDENITYSLTGGADQAAFTIDTSTGELSLLNVRDFENPTDANNDNVYEVQVTADNSLFATNQSVNITVTDVEEVILYATPNINLSSIVAFDGNALSVSSQELSPSGLAFNPSGTKLFIVGSSGDEVNQYSLANPFDINTGVTFDGNPFDIEAEEASAHGITFNPSGTRMFIVGNSGNEVNQYSLSTPFDITAGVTFDGSPFSVINEETSPRGITFNPIGTKMYIVGSSGDEVNQYSLTNPFDITSGVIFDGSPFSIASEETFSTGIAFNADGTKMFIVGTSEQEVNQYSLSNPFDITSGVIFDGNPFSVTDEDTSPSAIAFNADGTKMFIVGASLRQVNQYSLNNELAFVETITNNGAVAGSIIIRLIGDAFVNAGSTLSSGTHFILNNLPAGLAPTMTVAAGGTSATLTLGGNATSNQSTDNVSDLQFTFTDAAFTSGSVAGLTNAIGASSGFGIGFDIAPEFLSGNAILFAENDTSVALDVNTVDGLGGAVDENITYSLTGGADQAAFTIETSTGELSFLNVPDFENPTDANNDNVYEVQVNADNPPFATDQVITITVTNIEETVLYTTPAIDLSSGVAFDGNPLSVSSQESGPSAMAFNSTGTKLFIVGSSGDEVNQYSLTNPFDITTGVTFDESPLDIGAEEASAQGITFNPSGTRMFIVGASGDEVNQYSLTNPFDITTGVTFDGSPFFVATEESTPTDIAFNPSGTKMFIVGSSGDEVNQYSLANPFDITSGVTFDGAPFSVTDEDTSPQGIAFNASGTKMLIVGSSGDNVNQYSLSNPFDITSGVTFDGAPFSVTDEDTSPLGIAFNASSTKMFIVGSAGREVNQYSLNNEQVFIETTTNNGAVAGSIIIRLIGDAFVNVGSTLSSGTHFTLNNLPTGLTPTMSVAADGTSATLTLGGNATSNQSTDNVSDLQFTFTDAAFTSGSVAGLTNAIGASSGFGIGFDIAPEFLSGNVIFFAENDTSAVLDVNAVDGLGGAVDENITYSLTGGADQAAFTIETSTGELSFLNVPDFENPTDTNNDNVYEVQVTAGNPPFTTDQVITITVANIEEIILYATPGIDLSSGVTFDGNPLSVSSQESGPSAMAFNPSGTKLFIVGSSGDEVNQYSLSTPFDITTGVTFDGSPFDVNNEDTSPTAIAFNMIGTRMFIVGNSGNEVNQYSLSNPFDITSGVTFDGSPFSVVSEETSPQGIAFNPSGTKMFILGASGDDVNQYSLFTPFDITSGVNFDGSPFSVASEDTSPQGIAFNADGTKMFIAGSSGDNVNQYSLSNPFDITSGVTFDGSPFPVETEDTTPQGIAFNASGTKMFIVGSAGREVNQYSLNNEQVFIETTTNNGAVAGSIMIRLLGGETFVNAGSTLSSGTHFTLNNLPAGLTPTMSVAAGGTSATFTLGGNATSNQSADNVSDLQFTFTDAAFTSGNVAGLTNAIGASTGLGIGFDIVPEFLSGNSAAIPENETAVALDVNAVDGLGGAVDENITYSLTGGADQAAFTIDTSTGELSFLNVPDFENPTDANNDNVYEVQVTAGNPPFTTDQVITITVTNIEETVLYTTPAIDLSSGVAFDGNPLSVTSEEPGPTGMAFNSTGSKLFIVGSSGDEVNQYSLANAFDITTGVTFDGSPLDIGAEESSPQGITFNPSGTRMFIVGAGGDEVNQYSLSTPFDITSGVTFDGNPFFVGAEDTSPVGITFSPNGAKMFIVGLSGAEVNQYSVANPFDVTSGVTFDGSPFSVASEETSPRGIAFNADGTKMLIIGTSEQEVNQYNLSNPFDISSGVTFDGTTFHTGNEDLAPVDITFNTSATKMFIVGVIGREVNQYSLNNEQAFVETTENNGSMEGSMVIRLIGDTFINSGGALTSGTHFTLNNLPTGLAPTMTVAAGGTSATLTLGGNATSNQSTDNVSDLQFTFTDTAFTSENAAGLANAIGANSGFGIGFDIAPEFLSGNAISFAENDTSIVLDVNATNGLEGVADENITYSLTGGADQAAFAIDTSIGELGFLNVPDFEDPADANSDNVYEVQVTAGNPSFTTDQVITITITDIEEIILYATPGIDLSSGVAFDGNPLSIFSQESGPAGIAFNPTGTKLFIVGSSGDEVNQYSLTNPFDITTGVTFDGSPFSVNNEDSSPTGITFDPTGTRMFIVGNSGNDVNQYSLSNRFDITSGVAFDGSPFSVGTEESTPTDIAFNAEGTKMFILGASGDDVNQYSLSNPFDITSGVTFDGNPFSVASEDTSPQGIAFNADGTKMFIAGSSGDNVNQYSLSNPFDITSGVTFDGSPFPVETEDTTPQGIAFNASGTKMFVIGSTGREVNQYSLNNEQAFVETAADNGAVAGSIMIRLIGGDTFVNAGSTLSSGTHFTLNNLPAGLSPTMTVAADSTSATLILGGNAIDNLNLNDVSDLQFTFTDAAFTSGNAAGLIDAVDASSGLGIDFTGNSPPIFTSASSVLFPENSTGTILDINANDGDGGAEDIGITYSLTAGGDNDLFNIDSGNGQLTFNTAPDTENPGDADGNNRYSIEVRANDGALEATQNITVTVTDENDNNPEITSSSTTEVAENSAFVLTVAASDPDSTSVLTFSLGTDNDEVNFSIGESSGELIFTTTPDFENPADGNSDNIYVVDIRVSDGANTANQTLSITVTDLLDEAPVFLSNATALFAENGTGAVIDVDANDGDGGAVDVGVTYTLGSLEDSSFFEIDLENGQVRFVDFSPDFENPEDNDSDNVYEVEVVASDGINTASQVIMVTITDENDNPPTITSASSFAIVENIQEIMNISVEDLDTENTFTFSLGGGNDESLFKIDQSIGLLVFNSPPDFENPADANADNIYSVEVTVSDGVSSDNQTILITVTNEDEDPVFVSASAASFPENSSAIVLDINANDGDNGATDVGVTYSLASGGDNDLFAIGSGNGQLTFATAPDAENPGDTDDNNEYLIVVTADDGVNTSTQDIAITVTDENDNSPMITSTSNVTINENTTDVLTITADDADISSSLSFSLGSGNDENLMSLDASSGELTFNEGPDFENPLDMGADNIYNVLVLASDGLNEVDQMITINIEDLLNEAPIFISEASVTFSENSTANVLDVDANNGDGGQADVGVAYSLATGGDDNDLFDIDPNNGILGFTNIPDFENPQDANEDNVYEVVVTASDGVTSEDQPITIEVTDLNDNAPVITSSNLITIPENSMEVLTIMASDPDANSSFMFSLGTGNDEVFFSINDDSGELTFVSAPDFENPDDTNADNDYQVNVIVSDGTNGTNQVITISVRDENDNDPIFSSVNSTSIPENNTFVLTVTASDADANTIINFSFGTGNDEGFFVLDANSGILAFQGAPDFEGPLDQDADNDYVIQVFASDGLNMTNQIITITVTDENDNAPIISSSNFIEIEENSIDVLTVIASDADIASSLTFELATNNDESLFSIDGITGKLAFLIAPDFENPLDQDADNMYDVQVLVSDGINSTDQLITVAIADVFDDIPMITSAASVSVEENTTAVLTVTATGFEPGAQIDFGLGSHEDEFFFNIDTSSGELAFSTSPNFEDPLDADANNLYSLNVIATDGANSAMQTMTITVLDVNESPIVVTPLQNLSFDSEFRSEQINLSGTFDDEDGDALAISAITSDPAVLTVSTTGSHLIITAQGSGTAEVNVTADDRRGGTASTSFEVLIAKPEPLSIADDAADLNLYPNPVKEKLTISSEKWRGSNVIVKVFDLSGIESQVVYSKEAGKMVLTVDLLPPGMYIIYLIKQDERISKFFIKE